MAKTKSKKVSTAKNKNIESVSPPELTHLENIVGQFMEYWGFKKIHDRIWTHIYTSYKPLDSIELMSRLKVSKGLMSLAIRELLDYKVILADHVGRHGTTFYIANPDLLGVITNVLKERETKILAEAKAAGESLKKLNPQKLEKHSLSAEKIQNVVDFTESAQMLLVSFLGYDTDRPLAESFTANDIYNFK